MVGASAKSIGEEAKSEVQNLFVQIFDPTADEVSSSMFVGGEKRRGETSLDINDNRNSPLEPVTDYGVIWLTDYTDREVIAPQVVEADDKIVILWNVQSDEGCEAYFMVLSSDGRVISPAASFGKVSLNSYEKPIYHNGRIYWACAQDGIIRVLNIQVD